MPYKEPKEHTKDEVASIFDQLIAQACGGNTDKKKDEEKTTEENNEPKEEESPAQTGESETQKLVLKGRNETSRGNYAKSLKYFNQALELDPECWDAWSAMGDALMEMGKIDQASICYKKAMASTFLLDDLMDNDQKNDSETKENDWQDYLMTFLEPSKEESNKSSLKNEVGTKTPAKTPPEERGLDADLKDLFNTEQHENDQPLKEAVHFPCPSCGTDVELDSGACSKCQTTFTEEEFKNYEPMDDDLVFFGRIKTLLGKQERFFIHFNGEDGSIRFLDKKETSKTKKPSYVFVSANIEQLCYDYTSDAGKMFNLDDYDDEIEGE